MMVEVADCLLVNTAQVLTIQIKDDNRLEITMTDKKMVYVIDFEDEQSLQEYLEQFD